ncbi:hypothetical protein [uncultured Dechloromonas sp.]|uniref:hypothetical protein n=1 Tax=uncultured Dechloromonas sp. TaxID=171719 RepID=UPI0025CEAA45|nr:hypothetical protein [uncultured Dechloromonas sp.]
MASSEQTPAPVALPPELAQIAAEAEAIAPPPVADPAAPGAPAPEAPVDYQEDAALLVGMIFEGCAEVYPSTGVILQPKQTRFSAALGKVMEKRGWSLAAILGRWGAEIELGFVGATMAIPLMKAIQADRAAAQAAEARAELAQKPADPQPPRAANDPYNAAFPDPAAK